MLNSGTQRPAPSNIRNCMNLLLVCLGSLATLWRTNEKQCFRKDFPYTTPCFFYLSVPACVWKKLNQVPVFFRYTMGLARKASVLNCTVVWFQWVLRMLVVECQSLTWVCTEISCGRFYNFLSVWVIDYVDFYFFVWQIGLWATF